jgi:hypothetical protein
MQDRSPKCAGNVGIAHVQNKSETLQIAFAIEIFVACVQPRNVVPERRRRCQYPEPPRILSNLVDAL